MKVSHFKSQVASHLVHGPERQPLYFINSLGVRHRPLISCLGRQPDSKWKRITAHLHVSWPAMTRVNVMGIFGWKQEQAHHLPFRLLSFEEWREFLSAFSCENAHSGAGCGQDKWDCQWLSEVNLFHYKKVFDVWLENKVCLIEGQGCILSFPSGIWD